MKCPYTYANGRQCTGTIWQARAYGKHNYGIVDAENIKKIRLWCSEKGDHAGAVSSFATKDRMEFYPNELEQHGILQEAIQLCGNVPQIA
jgi:hypothetical protein